MIFHIQFIHYTNMTRSGRQKMIVNWTSYVARQERYLDLMRQAEKERLIREATGGRAEAALWRAFKARVLGIGQEQPRFARSPWGRGLAYQRK